MRQLCLHSLFLKGFTAIVLAAILPPLIGLPALANEARSEQREIQLESAFVQSGLAAIARWKAMLADSVHPLTGIDRRVVVESMLEEVTRLCEVDKLPFAEQHLRELLRREGREFSRFGFHPSGSLSANVTRLQLKNPAFENYTIFLFRLENRTPLELKSDGKAACRLVATNGASWELAELSPEHALYPHLSRMQAQFRMPDVVRRGAIASFELILNRPGITEEDIAYFLLTFGKWQIVIKFYENIPTSGE